MKTILIFLGLFLLTNFATAQTGEKVKNQKDHPKKEKTQKMDHDHHSKDHKPHKEKTTFENVKKLPSGKLLVKVKGMVCSFCAQGIEKNFMKRSEVKAVEVNLDNMEVTLQLKKGKTLSENTIREVVEGAGFNMLDMKHE